MYFKLVAAPAALDPFLLRNSTSTVVLSMTMALPSISLGRLQHFVHLSCPQTVQGAFPSEETLVRKEKRAFVQSHPADNPHSGF
jgi:hypothetical protein